MDGMNNNQNMQSQQNKPVRPQINTGQKPVRPQLGQGNGQNQKAVSQQIPIQQKPQQRNVQQNIESNIQQTIQIQSDNIDEQYISDDYIDVNSEFVNDTVADNKNRGKKKKGKIKVKKEKVELTPEQKKKRLIITITSVASVVVIISASIIIRNVLVSNSKHLTFMDISMINGVGIVVEGDANIGDEITITEIDENTEEQDKSNSWGTIDLTDAKTSLPDSPIELGEWQFIPVVVNTKIAGDNSNKDHKAKIYIRLSNVAIGYDKVIKYLDDYNEYITEYIKTTNSKDLKKAGIPKKEDFYRSTSGVELVAFEFSLLYPGDFPTNASEGIVYKLPQGIMNITGTDTNIDTAGLKNDLSQYIKVGESIYEVSKINDLTFIGDGKSKEAEIEIGQVIKLVYMTTLPIGASKDNYRIDLKFFMDKENVNLTNNETVLTDMMFIKGQEIKASDAYKEIANKVESEIKQSEETQQEETEQSEENSNQN